MSKKETNGSQHTEETLEEQPPRSESENLPIGKLLRQLREKKALTILDISRETNISFSNLTAVELANYNELPADTFIRGQITIYANFLGLDGTEAARLFFKERAQCLTGGEKKQLGQQKKGLSTKELAEPAHISSAAWAISLLLLITSFLALFSWYTGWNPFAYFFGQESAQISTTTAIAQPTLPEQEPETERSVSLASTPEQTVVSSSIDSPSETEQQTEISEEEKEGEGEGEEKVANEATNEPVEQITASE